MSLLRPLSPRARVLMVASGGCTAAALVGSQNLSSLQLVDTNPAQIALTKVKLFLLRHSSPERRMRFLGHRPLAPSGRESAILDILDTLYLSHDSLGSKEVWSELGLDHCGRYELLFAQLRTRLQGDLSVARRLQVFREVMKLDSLQSLFGEGATANRVQEFWEHFHLQTDIALKTDPHVQGPFLSQMLRGHFTAESYDWLSMESPDSWPHITWNEQSMFDTLREAESKTLDFVHLSNILDWLPQDLARQTIEEATRVLRPGGLLVIRQLNSTVSVRALGEGIKWLDSLSNRLLAADRSFFYRALHVGKKL
jgi:S-adenosylmethionine-diacylglycerol 3-amino-3-carboxypropyl transferase